MAFLKCLYFHCFVLGKRHWGKSLQFYGALIDLDYMLLTKHNFLDIKQKKKEKCINNYITLLPIC